MAIMVAIDGQEDIRFDPGEQLEEPLEALQIFSSLIALMSDTDVGEAWIQLFYYFVKEYLVSSSIFATQSCLVYLNYYSSDLEYVEEEFKKTTLRHPWQRGSNSEPRVAGYCFRYWFRHVDEVDLFPDSLKKVLCRTFSSKGGAYWRHFFDINWKHGIRQFIPTLHYVSIWVCISVVRFLLEELSADVNEQSNHGKTAMPYIMWHLSSSLLPPYSLGLKSSKAHGYNESQNTVHDNFLAVAVSIKHRAIETLLGAGGATVEPEGAISAFIVACRVGSVPALRLMVSRGIDINAMRVWQPSNSDLDKCSSKAMDVEIEFSRPFHEAIYTGQHSTVQALLDLGADFEAEINLHGTPLQAACGNCIDYGHAETIKILLENGVEMNKKNDIRTPLSLLCGSRYVTEDLINRFIARGSDPNLREKNSPHHPLYMASLRRREDTIEMFIEKGVDVENDEQLIKAIVMGLKSDDLHSPTILHQSSKFCFAPGMICQTQNPCMSFCSTH
ncbi:ankyrin [Corynespora cassiicola Philippines]|uniref:Ankyrin n=1 Tax=Corynespora cassiicola Philippines TaxID=1448308 RepID=A0A2T2N3U1_CORCC|nr:ankyrin [Corynespora cassiicola Philippines]